MDTIAITPAMLVFLLLAVAVAGGALAMLLMKRAPGAVTQSVEHKLFQTAASALKGLSDHTADLQIIEAANQRMALKGLLLQQVVMQLQPGLAPAPSAALQQSQPVASQPQP